jgi:hypothetical protein
VHNAGRAIADALTEPEIQVAACLQVAAAMRKAAADLGGPSSPVGRGWSHWAQRLETEAARLQGLDDPSPQRSLRAVR